MGNKITRKTPSSGIIIDNEVIEEVQKYRNISIWDN